MKAKEFMCRAWDHTQNSQPAKLTWSLLGMMNNCMYRVKVGSLQQALADSIPVIDCRPARITSKTFVLEIISCCRFPALIFVVPEFCTARCCRFLAAVALIAGTLLLPARPNQLTVMAGCELSILPCLQIHPSVAEGGAFALHFEHPTKADGLGGWMNRKEDAERLAAAEVRLPFCNTLVSSPRLVCKTSTARGEPRARACIS